MLPVHKKIIYTVGHSTRTFEEFIFLLVSFKIAVLADIRNYPGSRRYPHFNKEALEKSLQHYHIRYIHFPELGGRKKPGKDSKNIAWRNEAFRGYADHMESPVFKNAVTRLQEVALQHTTAYMCSEAVWWRCHRALLSDFFKHAGWLVLHIMDEHKAQEHPYTSAAKIVNDKLDYSGGGLLF